MGTVPQSEKLTFFIQRNRPPGLPPTLLDNTMQLMEERGPFILMEMPESLQRKAEPTLLAECRNLVYEP